MGKISPGKRIAAMKQNAIALKALRLLTVKAAVHLGSAISPFILVQMY